MLSFKQYLTEETEVDIPDEDKEWLYRKSGGTIVKNMLGTLSANNNLSLTRQPELRDRLLERVPSGGYELKYPFNLIDGTLDLENCSLVSFKNFPIKVKGSVKVSGNNFSSLEGLPQIIESTLDLSINQKLTSLKNIHKYVKECLVITLPVTIQSNVLGLLKIKELSKINLDYHERLHRNFETLVNVVKIVQYYLDNGRNIVACQEELFQNNLDEYAKL